MSVKMFISICLVFLTVTFAQSVKPPAGYRVDCAGYCTRPSFILYKDYHRLNTTESCAAQVEEFVDKGATAFSYNPKNKACLVYKQSCCSTKYYLATGYKDEFIYVKEGVKQGGSPKCKNITLVEDLAEDLSAIVEDI